MFKMRFWLPKPFLLQGIRMIFTLKKCTCWLHVGSIWEPRVPKTLLFTMNFNDVRGVVFEPQNEPKRSRRFVKLGQESPVLVPDSTSHTSPFAQMIEKHLSMSNLQETKVSLSAICTGVHVPFATARLKYKRKCQ